MMVRTLRIMKGAHNASGVVYAGAGWDDDDYEDFKKLFRTEKKKMEALLTAQRWRKTPTQAPTKADLNSKLEKRSLAPLGFLILSCAVLFGAVLFGNTERERRRLTGGRPGETRGLVHGVET